jgi:hypothetical protein
LVWRAYPALPGLDRVIERVEDGRVYYLVAYVLEDKIVTAAACNCLVKSPDSA